MGTPLHVLIVEDSEDDAVLLISELRRGGYEPTLERVDTPEAMNAALGGQTWDIVLCDYAMPRFSMPAALTIVQEKGLDIPFIIVSGAIGEEAAVAAVRAGANDYVMKGNLARLVPVIERELSEGEIRRERNRMKQALVESEEKLRAVFEAIPEGVTTTDIEGNIRQLNDAVICMHRYDRKEELIGRSAFELISPIDHAKAMENMKKTLEEGSSGLIEYTLVTKDGKEFDAELSAALVSDESGNPAGFVAVTRDITERKKAEEALQQSEYNYRVLFDSVIDGLAVVDAETMKIVLCNEHAAQTYGFDSVEAAIGVNPLDYIHPDDKERVLRIIVQDMFEKDLRQINEFRMITNDGEERWISAVGTRIKYQGKLAGLASFRDITDRKRAEEETEKIAAQLLQAQKMEAIGSLAGGIAHDFNNLITTIQGYAHMAMMEIEEADALYLYLKRIDAASSRAAKLTRQLLLFSRKNPMEVTSLNINETVEDLLKMLKRLIGEDIAINTYLEPDIFTVRADAGNIDQVIMNLAVNARDAMPEGGKLTITTENVTLSEEQCTTIPEAQPGKYACLSVADTGVGIEKEIIEYIFEPFFSTKEPGEGTGLGLSVVYGIAKQHGGWINVYSEPGQGSTFKLYLPAIAGKPELKSDETILAEELQGNGERILLVEDDGRVREFLADALNENGHVVFEAANAEEALDIFDSEQGEFHLVFSDVVLPDINGFQLADQLLSRKPELPVLLGSGYINDKLQRPIIHEKEFQILPKPYTLAELLRAVREAMGAAQV